MNYETNIGRRVIKGSITRREPNAKPFKSGQQINTVRGVINHPELNVPTYVFDEDNSYVECRRCIIIDTHEVVDLVYHEDEGNSVFQGTQQECENWKSEQGFGHQVVPIIRK